MSQCSVSATRASSIRSSQQPRGVRGAVIYDGGFAERGPQPLHLDRLAFVDNIVMDAGGAGLSEKRA